MKTWTTTADPDNLTFLLAKLGCRITTIAYETGPCGFTLQRTLREAGFNAIVVGANKIPRQASLAPKTTAWTA